MSIITSFDNKTKAMISPEDIVSSCETKIDTCIIMWQHKIRKELLEQDLVEEILSIRSGNGPRPIYRVKGTNIAVYESHVSFRPMRIETREPATTTALHLTIFLSKTAIR